MKKEKKDMKLFKKLTTLLAAGIMTLAVGVTAVAAEGTNTGTTGTEDAPATVSVCKELVMADGLKVPTEAFKFTATKVTKDAPEATIVDISFTEADKTAATKQTDGTYKLTKESEIKFGTFPHAGQYEYIIAETTGTNEHITYATNKYKLIVDVANDTKNGLYVHNIVAKNAADDTKPEALVFTNTYHKTQRLTISKTVVGAFADKTKEFTFRITMTPPVTSTATTFLGIINDKKDDFVEVQKNTVTEFTLHHGETLTFATLPVGTTYTITEVGSSAAGYTAKVDVTENGTKVANEKNTNTTAGTDLTACNATGATILVGELLNSVEYTNTNNETPATGLVLNNLPAILMLVIALIAVAAFGIINRQRNIGR